MKSPNRTPFRPTWGDGVLLFALAYVLWSGWDLIGYAFAKLFHYVP